MSVVGETLSINAWSESSWVDLHCSTLKECATQDEILLSPQWDTLYMLSPYFHFQGSKEFGVKEKSKLCIIQIDGRNECLSVCCCCCVTVLSTLFPRQYNLAEGEMTRKNLNKIELTPILAFYLWRLSCRVDGTTKRFFFNKRQNWIDTVAKLL